MPETPGSEKCPVLSFEKYISKLNPDCYSQKPIVRFSSDHPDKDKDQKTTVRYSSDLSDKEKQFLDKRKKKVMDALGQLLDKKQGPSNLDEVPTVAVIGSGGGIRATIGFSGVFKALHESGILQCTTYVCGLSGSAWYISSLYSHEDFPTNTQAHGWIQEELKNNLDSSPVLEKIPRKMYYILKKRIKGQPVSFTDLFGHFLGDKLLKGQQQKIENGGVPMPLLTSVTVRKEDSFFKPLKEMMEFSPYEIGLIECGKFVPTELFGSKFVDGKLYKRFEEHPLHFLQGIWGSAYSIIFKQLFDDNERFAPQDVISQEKGTRKNFPLTVKALYQRCIEAVLAKSRLLNSRAGRAGVTHDFTQVWAPQHLTLIFKLLYKIDGSDNNDDKLDEGEDHVRDNTPPSVKSFHKRLTPTVAKLSNYRADRAGVTNKFTLMFDRLQRALLAILLAYLDGSGIVAAVMHQTKTPQLHIVDAGLVFNSPYPPVIRAQRRVDVILSFDFSTRPCDNTDPFKELVKAEDWAKERKMPFPKIDTGVYKSEEGMKELYIFEDTTDPHCPVVLHFCLVNNTFKEYSAPGVKRDDTDKHFADFDVFDDLKEPYSTFKFQYSNNAFDRLAQLTEFNTRLNVERVKEVFADIIEHKRRMREQDLEDA